MRQTIKLRHPAFDVNERPFIVIWEVTRACDLACVHCRATAMPWPNPRQLTTEEGMDLIDQVAEIGHPPPLFIMTGGDPMKRADLHNLIFYASERRLPVALSPSATPLLKATELPRLKAAGLKAMSLSLDGPTADIHDRFRGIEGTFARTIDAWKAARDCGLKIQINTTVTKANLFDLPAIAHMVKEVGALTWSVFFLVPLGRGINLNQLSAIECEDVMHFLYDVSTVIPVKTTEGHHFKRIFIERTILDQENVPPEEAIPLGPTYYRLRDALSPWPQYRPGVRRTPMDVNAGKGFVFVSHIGAVCPSGFLPVAAGNVRTRKLAEIYRDSPAFRRLRQAGALPGKCGACEFSAVCGGSRSRAFAVSRDVTADDPLCSYEPGTFPYPVRAAEMISSAAPVEQAWARLS